MSTRYVWEKFDVKALYTEQSANVNSYTFTPNGYNWCNLSQNYTFNQSTGFFLSVDPQIDFFMNESVIPLANANTGYHIFPCTGDFSVSNPQTDCVLVNDLQSGKQLYWQLRRQTNGTIRVILTNSDDFSASLDSMTAYNFSRKYGVQNQYTQGEISQGKISASESNAYPTGGANSAHSIWYKYLGSDSIDPESVTYSASDTFPGDTITAYVNAASPTYGGTVYYQYSYRVNGGSWTNIGSKTTATSITLTVPENATSIQVRTIASDDWGFTSTTYVTGSTLSVAGMKCYVGVGGKARQITKIYVGVNGKAREVTAAYVGVNGKARKIF